MKKVQRRNWLLLLTCFFFGVCIFLFYIGAFSERSGEICEFNGIHYENGDIVPDYKEYSNCVCRGSKGIVCEDIQKDISYGSFGTEGLDFSYQYVQSLGKSNPDYTKVKAGNIDQNQNSIRIALEREAYCSDDGEAPIQTGLYSLEENSLVLTTLTNKDSSIYTVPCVIRDIFLISNISIPKVESFSVLYKSEENKIFDLGACYYDGILYGQGDIFESTENGKICTCDSSTVNCD
ncbi:MAG TPA: hypothetical protein PLD77_00885 [Candidatus Dojkabacteria bacterium]|nr:hypothetical protein [Candidatus Dojkabacteria bacterium]